MKRWLVPTALVAAALMQGSEAKAIELGTPASDHPYRSAQHFALELRLSPYNFNVDDEFNGAATPFADTFGTKPRLFIGFEFDWQVFRIPHFGTIGPGFGMGYTSASRNVQTATGRASGDETSLSVIPFWANAVLRADVFWHDFGFPIVPYVKAGLAVGLWRATNTGGTARGLDNVPGKGTTWGTNLAAGVMLALDALDKGASRNMDNATGINSTYLYFEVYDLGLRGIGQDNPLRVGTTSWTAGLAFEF